MLIPPCVFWDRMGLLLVDSILFSDLGVPGLDRDSRGLLEGVLKEKMVFKFALTNGDDILGFIYIEILPKFKMIKKFKIDDWFPIK